MILWYHVFFSIQSIGQVTFFLQQASITCMKHKNSIIVKKIKTILKYFLRKIYRLSLQFACMSV
jgi:hypothetical protein